MDSEERVERVVAHLAGEHGQALVTNAFLLCGDAEEARDIVQAVLARLLNSKVAEAGEPVAYARRAVTNEFLDRRRRHKRLLRALVVLKGEARHADAPDQRVAERDALSRAFDVLNPRERAAVVLRFYEGWDDAAIAESLGCAPATVRSLLSRSMPKLRGALSSATTREEIR